LRHTIALQTVAITKSDRYTTTTSATTTTAATITTPLLQQQQQESTINFLTWCHIFYTPFLHYFIRLYPRHHPVPYPGLLTRLCVAIWEKKGGSTSMFHVLGGVFLLRTLNCYPSRASTSKLA